MHIHGRFTVLPNLPQALERLRELADNLYWTWDPRARDLFRRLAPELWERTRWSPVALLREVSQRRLDAAAEDEAFLDDYARVLTAFDSYMAAPNWFARTLGAEGAGHLYAYFCAEYGWHESVPIYSGGLGILAGDHTKVASDLGVPLVAVGLWYPEGYFHQRVDREGRQEAVYQRLSPFDLPMRPALDGDGNEVRTSVTVFGREISIRALELNVGRVRVFLLDVDLPENHEPDRSLLARLYGGDQQTRIAQEIVLGVGGVRMLRSLGVQPTSWHMNEGHSAFMVLERCREYVSEGMTLEQAKEAVVANTVFTIHTPVAAGNDAFSFELIDRGFDGYWGSLGLEQQEFHRLGSADHGWGPVFSMPALALRFTSGRNGVARLHGATSRAIWNDLWPEVPTEEVPIGHVTNGVHVATWVASEIQELFDKALPDDWRERLDDLDLWSQVEQIDEAELWSVRKAIKARSIRFLRRRVVRQLTRQGASPTAIRRTSGLFDPEALTIGFARRFTSYKRATLIFTDMQRLDRILNDSDRPVQLVFAGKAHPADLPGQDLISRIHNLSRDPAYAGKILFVEDYDMAVGRALTRGVDVWLNNPRRPLEASGTSGQKAAMNGVLNLSILDGWWPEGYDGENGWAIGSGRAYGDEERTDAADADALYHLLEREVVPLYYDRNPDGIPEAWMVRAKRAIATIVPRFNAQRMVQDYVRAYYVPASDRGSRMAGSNFKAAVRLARWRRVIDEVWTGIYLSADRVEGATVQLGDAIVVEAELHPSGLGDIEVRVEVVYSLESDELKRRLYTVPLKETDPLTDGRRTFKASFSPKLSGRIVYGVRAYPVHPDLVNPFDALAIRWARGADKGPPEL